MPTPAQALITQSFGKKMGLRVGLQAVLLLANMAVVAETTTDNNNHANTNTQVLQKPVGGWNIFDLTDRAKEGRVAYPTPPIDRGTQKNRTPIQGNIAPTDKKQVPKLVVNGNAMPLYSDATGRYERYYAFGEGSNSIEIKDARGNSLKRNQFYQINRNQPLPKLRIICAWDEPRAEVDLHIVTPDGQHVAFSKPVLKTGGGLDLDSVDGPGPEMFTTAAPVHGTYQIYVNYWGNLDENGYNFNDNQFEKTIITTRITIVTNENTVNEKRETFSVPLRKIGELNFIKSFTY